MSARLSDRCGFPDSVLRSPKPAVFDAISATVCMTIIAIAADAAARPVTQLAA